MQESRIGEQNSSYRRGMVLGLTMAEVALLVIFVLMLFLARQLREYGNKVPITAERHTEWLARDSLLDDAAERAGLSAPMSREDFIRVISSVAAQVSATQEGKAAAQSAVAALGEMRSAADRASSRLDSAAKGGADSVRKAISDLGYQIANQEGQITQLQEQVRAKGGNPAPRSCWMTVDGRAEYLYDIVLLAGGIKIRTHDSPSRVSERAALPLPAIEDGAILTPADFSGRMRPIYDYARERNCRFLVHVWDGMEDDGSKVLFKSMLRTVEARFYVRRHDLERPPF